MSGFRSERIATHHRSILQPIVVIAVMASFTGSFVGVAQADDADTVLRQQIANSGIAPLPPSALGDGDRALIDLGRSLFHDRELGGNRETSCASCHHPSLSSGDSRSLPSGVGGEGLGPDRTQGADREIVPRNSPEIFHRGNPEWVSMFWDSRVTYQNDQFDSPAGPDLPPGLNNVLAVQAMFPVTSRDEMRGKVGDVDIFGQTNELAKIDDNNLPDIWQGIMNRLLAIPEYQQQFAGAFPNVPAQDLGFQHAANAIAAYEESSFSPQDSAWDRYVAGDNDALTEAAKRGASHFFGGSCVSCHSGNLLTDQSHHNLGVPQLGPGKDPTTGLDVGRALVTGNPSDEFGFRTPPLRNVMLTGPWTHNGAFTKLADVIRHDFDPAKSLANYDVSQLDESLQDTVRLDAEMIAALTESLDPLLPIGEELTEGQLSDLMAYLFSLTSPSSDRMLHLTPSSVPSGLEVDQMPAGDIRVIYDPQDGRLQLTGPEELTLDALFLRISADEDGTSADFKFHTGAAPWSHDGDIILSDEEDAQSFIDYRSAPRFLLAAGDEIEAMLPDGLTADAVADHLSAAYRVQGSPVLWIADVASMVPEPSSLLLMAIGMLAVCYHRRT